MAERSGIPTDAADGGTPPIAEAARRAIPAFALSGDRLMTVGGRRVPAVSGQTLPNVDPSTESPLASVPRGDAEDVDTAVRAAQQAFTDPAWSGFDPGTRYGDRGFFVARTLLGDVTPDMRVVREEIHRTDAPSPASSSPASAAKAGPR